MKKEKNTPFEMQIFRLFQCSFVDYKTLKITSCNPTLV